MHRRNRKRNKRSQQRIRTHSTYFPRVGVVQLAPSRESVTPFCAYYGPEGETCVTTTGLKTVFTLPSSLPYAYMACPLHYDAVSDMVQRFLASLRTFARRAQ